MNVSRRFLLGSAVSSFALSAFYSQTKYFKFSNTNQNFDTTSTQVEDIYKASVKDQNSSLVKFLSEDKIHDLTIFGNEVDITNEFKAAIEKRS